MFEGSYLGDPERIGDDARLECGICWWVYDPVHGDPGAGVAPGTPFARLPAHWHCPICDGLSEKFMVVTDG